jgi:predicted PurR-regulated permease PerM
MVRHDDIPKTSWIMTLAAIVVVVAAVYLAKGVLIPLTLAVLLSFLLSPFCDWVERGRLGRIPAVLVTATLGFAVLGLVAWTAVVQMSHIAPKLPEYQRNLEVRLKAVNEYAVLVLSKVTRTAQGMDQNPSSSREINEPQGTDELPFSVRVLSSPASPLKVFGGMFGTLLEVLGTTAIVIVLVVFFLIRREDLRDRFIHLMGHGHVTVTIQMLEDAGTRVSRYLLMLFFINVTFGISVAIGLYFIGVPNALLWGIMATVLRFIPYIGPWVAAAMPIALSLAISTGWVAPVLTVGLFIVLELFSNNVMEPWLYGRNTGVSAVAVLVAAMFWMWLWGPVGLLLATPLTVCLLVVGKHVPQLSFLGILLGSDPVFAPEKRIYQRLLAGDQEEAVELLDAYLADQPLVEVYDAVLIPAMALAETHWQLGELNDAKHQFIMQSLKDMAQIHHERQRERLAEETAPSPVTEGQADVPAPAAPPPQVHILCAPARSEADEVAALLLAHILDSSGCLVQAVSITSLASEMVELFEQQHPDVACISATAPAAVMHARYMCNQLRSRFPNLALVVGLWDFHSDLDKAQERIGCGATVVATLAAAQSHIQLLAQCPRDEDSVEA